MSELQEFRVRAYMVLNTAGYLREKVGEGEARRLFERFTPETQNVLQSGRPADWCRMPVYKELLHQVAAFADGNEDRAREELIKAGEHVAREATNSFLRLLMKMLNPSLFAKKLPDFWKRDCSGGRLEVEVTEQTLVCRYFEMTGFDHILCTGAGFAKFALQSMGKPIESVLLHGWSLKEPYSEGSYFKLAWSK